MKGATKWKIKQPTNRTKKKRKKNKKSKKSKEDKNYRIAKITSIKTKGNKTVVMQIKTV